MLGALVDVLEAAGEGGFLLDAELGVEGLDLGAGGWGELGTVEHVATDLVW